MRSTSVAFVQLFTTVCFRKIASHFNFSPLSVSEAHCALHTSCICSNVPHCVFQRRTVRCTSAGVLSIQLGARLFHGKMNTFLAQTIFQENHTFQICSFSARLIVVTIYRVFFFTGPPLKKTKSKIMLVSRLGFPKKLKYMDWASLRITKS